VRELIIKSFFDYINTILLAVIVLVAICLKCPWASDVKSIIALMMSVVFSYTIAYGVHIDANQYGIIMMIIGFFFGHITNKSGE